MKQLVVISPFGGREAGEPIADMAEIAEVLAGENAHRVVAVERDAPETEVDPAADAAPGTAISTPEEE